MGEQGRRVESFPEAQCRGKPDSPIDVRRAGLEALDGTEQARLFLRYLRDRSATEAFRMPQGAPSLCPENA